MSNSIVPAEAHTRAMKARADSFAQFVRNGVWGTCAACPRTDGKAYPEFCQHGHRSDHQLSFKDLVESYEISYRIALERFTG